MSTIECTRLDSSEAYSAKLRWFCEDCAAQSIVFHGLVENLDRCWLYSFAERCHLQCNALPGDGCSISCAKTDEFYRKTLQNTQVRSIAPNWEQLKQDGWSLRFPPGFFALVASRFEEDRKLCLHKWQSESNQPCKLTDKMELSRLERDGPWMQIVILNKEDVTHLWLERVPLLQEVFGYDLLQCRKVSNKMHLASLLLTWLENRFRPTSSSLDTLKCLGVGYKTKNAPNGDVSEAYYMLYDWPWLHDLRNYLGLPFAPVTVTLGFEHEDVHGIVKDASTLIVRL
jgi:hypothetical protein